MPSRINEFNLQARHSSQVREPTKLSRRNLLKAGAAAAFLGYSGSTILRKIGQLSVATGPGWLSLREDGVDKFRIVSARYHGSPKIWHDIGDSTLAFGVRQVRFPGTSLVADLVCEIWDGTMGPQALVTLDSLNLSLRGYVHDWLNRDGLTGHFKSNKRIIDRSDLAVILHGGSANLNARGELKFHGRPCATVRCSNQELLCQTLNLGLQHQEASLLRNGSSRRTQLLASRGSSHWPMRPQASHWTYQTTDGPSLFDALEIEAHESTGRRKSYAVVATRNALRVPISLGLQEPLRGTDNDSADFSMTKFIYAQSFSAGDASGTGLSEPGISGDATADPNLRPRTDSLTTAYLLRPASLQLGGLALNLSNPASRPALRVVSADQSVSASFVTNATLQGQIDEAIISPESTKDSWPVEVGASQDTANDTQTAATSSVTMKQGSLSLTGSLILRVLRPADFLDIRFELANVQSWVNDGTLYVGKKDSARPSLLIAHLGPQTLAEQAYLSSLPTNDDQCTVKPNAAAFLPKESRVSLEILPKKDEVAMVNLDLLLGWEKYPIHVCGDKMPGDDNEKAAYTALVMPAGLTFSPASSAARFSTPKGRPRGPFGSPISNNRDTYSTHSGDTYRLWTGRLSGDMNVVAVDADKAATSTQFGLTDLQRQEILTQVNRSNLLPTQHAVVSTAGGWLKGHTRLKPIDCPTTETAFLDSLSLNIAGGIEILEQVSFPIFLIPTGHRGSLVKTTQRQWCRDTDDTLQGVLVTHYKIVIAERCRFYDADHYWPTTGSYPFPFTKIEIPIRETPNLDASLAKTFADNDCASCADIASTPYWAMMLQPPDYKSDVPFSFPVICTDRDGTAYRTSLSMVVAAGIRAFHCTQHYIPNLLTAYLNSTGVTQQVFPNFNGANIAYATSNKPGDAAYPTGEMRWYADAAPSAAYPLVPWSPKMTSAALALSTTAGFSQNGTASSQTFAYSHYYLSAPFDRATRQGQKVVPATPNPDGNKAEIILAAVGATSSLDFYAKLGGGLFQPTTGIGALSRAAGNIFSSGVKATNGELKSIEDMANGTLDALDALADTATLLGAVGLNQIIAPVQNIVQNIASVPKLISQEIGQLPQDIQTVTDTLNTLYTALQAQSLQDALAPLLNTIAPQVAYVRAFVFEQLASNPQYLGALSDVAYLQTLLGNPVVSSLQAQLANSLASRIQSTVTLVDANTPATLVTLNRMRDYLLNAALQSSDMTAPVVLVISAFSADLDSLTVTDAKAKAIADALNADAKTLSDDLLAFQTALQNVLAQSASAYTSVTNAVTQLQAAIQSITDPVGVINSLQQLAALLSNLPDPLTDILNSGAPALQAVIDTATNINKDVTQIFTDFGALVALAGQEPGAVLKAASKDVATELSHIQSTLGSELKLVTTAFGQGANGFKATLTTLEGFYSQFKQKAAQAAGVLNQFLQTVNELKQVRASYDYDTPLKDFDLFIASKGGQPASLSVHTSITVNVPGLSENPPSPDLIVSAAVNNFTLLLIPEFPFLSVGFDSATMTSTNGSTPVVDCKLDGKSVQFVGPMNLVMDLAENIALPGGLSVQQTADGVSVAFSLAVPSIESGAFLMSNLSLYSGVALDFTGQAIKVNFGFADPNHHFVMTYTVFGGGGYLDFQFSPQRGLSAFDISGALEFGAEAALDFGVASGDLYIFGGFLFNMTGDELDLGGYLRAGGDLNVLDLITASVEFSMSLAYENRSGTAWLVGECDITVDVDIAWVIDVSVDLRLHREFCNTSAN